MFLQPILMEGVLMYSDLVSIPSNCTSECKLRLVSLQRRQSSGTPTGPYLLSPLRHTDLCSNLIAGHTWFSSQQKINFFFFFFFKKNFQSSKNVWGDHHELNLNSWKSGFFFHSIVDKLGEITKSGPDFESDH